jgi:anti-sigma regulatory factor (Ser/Thr protein kinase)
MVGLGNREGGYRDEDMVAMEALAPAIVQMFTRRQVEEELRQRAEELAKVMDVVPIAIWVGHDPECRSITGNKTANEFYEAQQGENVSATTTPVRRFFRNGRELAPEELPMQYAAIHNVDIRDVEFEVEMPSGTRRTLWGYASPLRHTNGEVRGAVGAFVEVTGQRELERHKREFYCRTILAATEGKLVVCEKDEIEEIAGPCICTWHIKSKDDLSNAMEAAKGFAVISGLQEQRAYEFLGCVTEAAANVIKHANGGTMTFHKVDGKILCVVSDGGPGIGTMALPDVALTRFYSTAGTLGMGYKLMIRFADHVYLATGPEGTTVAIEMVLHTTA